METDNIINWIFTAALIIIIAWLLYQKTYCGNTIIINPNEAIQWINSNTTNWTLSPNFNSSTP